MQWRGRCLRSWFRRFVTLAWTAAFGWNVFVVDFGRRAVLSGERQRPTVTKITSSAGIFVYCGDFGVVFFRSVIIRLKCGAATIAARVGTMATC